MSILDQLGPPEYAAAIFMCTSLLIAFTAEWWRPLLFPTERKKLKLYDLRDEIRLIIPDETFARAEMFDNINAQMRRRLLEKKLRDIGVACPCLTNDFSWISDMKELAVLAATKEYRKAVQLFDRREKTGLA